MSPAAVSQGPGTRGWGFLAGRRCTTKPVRLPAPSVRHCSRTSVRARVYRSLLMVTLGGAGYPAARRRSVGRLAPPRAPRGRAPPPPGLTINAEADGEAGGAHAVGGGAAVGATVLRPLGIAHGEVGPRPAALQPVLGGARRHLALLRVVPAHLGTQLAAAALPACQPRLAALQHRHLTALRLQLGDICAVRGAAGGVPTAAVAQRRWKRHTGTFPLTQPEAALGAGSSQWVRGHADEVPAPQAGIGAQHQHSG